MITYRDIRAMSQREFVKWSGYSRDTACAIMMTHRWTILPPHPGKPGVRTTEPDKGGPIMVGAFTAELGEGWVSSATDDSANGES